MNLNDKQEQSTRIRSTSAEHQIGQTSLWIHKNCRIDGKGPCPSQSRQRVINWNGLRYSWYNIQGDASESRSILCNCQACRQEWGEWSEWDRRRASRTRTSWNIDQKGHKLSTNHCQKEDIISKFFGRNLYTRIVNC